MKATTRRTAARALAVSAMILMSVTIWAQAPDDEQDPPKKQGGQRNGQGGDGQAAAPQDTGPKLPSDPRLLALHKDFVVKAEKLATEYENKRDIEKARVVYEEILKLVPGYPKAVAALEKINQQELSADRAVFSCLANKSWQDTNVRTVAGKPIQISAGGTWTVKIEHDLGGNGMEIPKELRDFNLGSLVGVIDTGSGQVEDFRPFLIGESYEFVAEETGRLMLAMWDTDHSDNTGKLSVTIRGTFEKK